MREFAPDFDGMFAMLDGNRVLNVPIWIRGEVLGTVERCANHRRAAISKPGYHDTRQAAGQRIRYACVDAVGAGRRVNVDVDEVKCCPVVTKPRFVYYSGAWGIDP